MCEIEHEAAKALLPIFSLTADRLMFVNELSLISQQKIALLERFRSKNSSTYMKQIGYSKHPAAAIFL